MVKNRHLVVWTAEPLYLYILPNLPILNIANNGTAKYGYIQKSRTTVNSNIVNNILYAIWYDMLNIANIIYCTLPYCVLYHIIWFVTILKFPNQSQLIAICTDHHNRRRFTILTVLTIL